MTGAPFDCWYRLGRLLSRIFIPTFGSIRVTGRERVPKGGPLIIVANHQSNADPPVMVYAVPRPIFFMAKRSLFWGPIVSYLLRAVHVYPVDRDGRDVDALKWALRTLNSGRALLIFPEGTRSPGGLRKATDGLAYLALSSGAPVLPVAITGTERIRGMFRIAFHFQKLHVTIGEPFVLPRSEGRVDREQLQAATEEVMNRIAALLPPPYRGVYAGGAPDDVEGERA
ncbi:MAG: lysophospholipid acyltransferase family protein [Chloroflexota bacterium]|nr:lysophospholipid acyltransferase family protein [Chloroflexota bacterium]MDE2886318.1 lysophospholipid acyltransferase family protein [Chloroflexota bacterium]